jgi:hypothetical protein
MEANSFKSLKMHVFVYFENVNKLPPKTNTNTGKYNVGIRQLNNYYSIFCMQYQLSHQLKNE